MKAGREKLGVMMDDPYCAQVHDESWEGETRCDDGRPVLCTGA